MYRSLNIKLVLTFVVLILSVMTAVGVFLINSVFAFYVDDFISQIEQAYSSSIEKRMKENLLSDSFAEAQKELLLAYAGDFGFDGNRIFHILDSDGNILSSFENDRNSITKTANILAAMNGKTSCKQVLGSDYMDYAIYIENGQNRCILYVKDNLVRMHRLSGMLFNIIMQSVMIGLALAILLSFVLANAITKPILSLTKGTIKIAEGEYTHRLKAYSKDEIGVLTKNFNSMAQVIENTLMAVSGEREKLKTILDCLEDGVCAFDEDGNILHTNPQIVKMLNLSESDLKLADITAKLNCENVTCGIIRVLERPLIITEQNLSSDKVDFYVDISFSSFSYDNKKKGIVAVVRDVTERSIMEKSRREFIANVSHELRTPLTSVKGAAEAIYTDDEMPDEIRKRFLSIVLGESDRMTHIVKDLLVLSRLDNRRMQWKLSSFDVCASLGNAVEALSIVANQSNLEMSFENLVGDEKCELFADKERIEQVFTNIIGNSVKYTPSGGRISVVIQKNDGDKVQITVTDNGIGIPEKDLPHLFERFYRVEKSRNTDAGGTGLGLSIAKEIIDAHGGKIIITSTEGKGTQTTLILPMKAEILIDEQ